MTNFIGVDNGLSGAIAVIKESGPIVLFDMPTLIIKEKRKYNIPGICEIFKLYGNAGAFVTLEQAQPYPGQGVVSMFSTGYCYGVMQGILTALCIPFQIVPPQRWKSTFSLKGSEKKDCVPVAQRLFPFAEFITPRGRLIDGRADAALLAEYGRRNYR